MVNWTNSWKQKRIFSYLYFTHITVILLGHVENQITESRKEARASVQARFDRFSELHQVRAL